MAFFDKFFASSPGSLPENWQSLEDESTLERIIRDSSQKPVVIFKHSIRCGTSSMVKNQIAKKLSIDPERLDFYYLDLINHRGVSNRIAEVFSIQHESPQLILIKDGQAVYHASHHWIDTGEIINHL